MVHTASAMIKKLLFLLSRGAENCIAMKTMMMMKKKKKEFDVGVVGTRKDDHATAISESPCIAVICGTKQAQKRGLSRKSTSCRAAPEPATTKGCALILWKRHRRKAVATSDHIICNDNEEEQWRRNNGWPVPAFFP